MVDIDALTDLITPQADALGLAVVRIAFFGGDSDPTLQVMAERPDTRQLTIDDCAALSRRISDLFDAMEAEGRDPIDQAYRLEVSSPGIDRPLTRAADFADWAGHEARITLAQKRDGRLKFQGELEGLAEDGTAAALVDRAGDRWVLPLADIASAKLVLTDKLIAATVPLSPMGADELEEEGQD